MGQGEVGHGGLPEVCSSLIVDKTVGMVDSLNSSELTLMECEPSDGEMPDAFSHYPSRKPQIQDSSQKKGCIPDVC